MCTCWCVFVCPYMCMNVRTCLCVCVHVVVSERAKNLLLGLLGLLVEKKLEGYKSSVIDMLTLLSDKFRSTQVCVCVCVCVCMCVYVCMRMCHRWVRGCILFPPQDHICT